MKKVLSVILLTLMLASLLCVGALADGEPTVAGLYGFESTQGVTITPYTATDDTTQIMGDDGFYEDAVRFDVTYTNDDLEEGEQCLLLVCSGSSDAPPSADNIVYINQKAAAEKGKVIFDGLDRAYPSKLGKGDYRIYVVSENSPFMQDTPTATFKYYVPYILGDVDNSGGINTNDAVLVLKHCAELEMLTEGSSAFLAADVDKSANINTNDAVQILKYVAELITSFD